MEGIKAKVTLKDVWEALGELIQYRKILLLGSLIGCWLGIQPGGATPASFMAYGFAKGALGDKEEFGKGASPGIIAPEAAGHGAGTSATLPMITLGIPGSPTMAVIMGGLMIFGLQPGPMLFKEHTAFVWGIIGSCWVGNFLGLFLVLAFAPLFAAILKIRFGILLPVDHIRMCDRGLCGKQPDDRHPLHDSFRRCRVPLQETRLSHCPHGAGPGSGKYGRVSGQASPHHGARESAGLLPAAHCPAVDVAGPSSILSGPRSPVG